MSDRVDALKGKVQRILAEKLGSIEVDKDGDFTVRNESTRLFVRCREWGDDSTVIKIWAPFLFKVPASPELYEWVATQGAAYHFGSVLAAPGDEGLVLSFQHTLLGDYLDAEELYTALFALGHTANQLDDELQARFGGIRFHEDG